MNVCKRVLLCGVFFLFIPFTFGQTTSNLENRASTKASAELRKGVVVDTVKKNLEAYKAGLQNGDILLSWTRADAKGEIASPFDVSEIEAEQAPRGTVTLEGLRGTTKRTWVLEPGSWGVDTRPNLPESLLVIYLEGQKLATGGKLQDAVARLQSAAGKVQESQSSWLAPWFLFQAGELLANARQWKEADVVYEEAVQESSRAGPAVKVHLLRAWALSFLQQGDWSNAVNHYQQAAEESRKISPESLILAETLDKLAYSARQRGDLGGTERYHLQALAIRERLASGSLAVAKSLYFIGMVAADQGDLIKANNYCEQALAITEKLEPGGMEMANDLTGLGSVASLRGNLSKAEELYRQALAVEKKVDPGGMPVAASFTNLGHVAQERGDLNKAEEYYRRGLEIWEKLAPDTLLVAANLNYLGSVVLERDSPDKAEEYYQKALAIEQRQAPGGEGVAWSLMGLGLVAQNRGDFNKAEVYHRQALAIEEKFAPGSLNVAGSLSNLGNVARSLGDLNKSEGYHCQALAIAEKSAPGSLYVAASMGNLGDVARDRGDWAKAEEYYRQEQAIWEKLAPERKEYAETLAALAAIMVHKQQWAAAAPLLEKALNVLDSQLSHLGGGEATRTGFRAQHASYYQNYIDLLMQQKQPELALQVLERSRAQTMLEMLTEGRVDVHQGVDVALLERERSLQADLSAKVDRRIHLKGEHAGEQVAAMNKEIELLLAQYNEVESQIRTSSPSYAALTQPQSLSTKDIQQQLLDADTVLLEYSLGEERSYVFAVTPTALTGYELPKRADIESTALQVYELLTARNRTIKGEPRPQQKARLAKAETEFKETTAALSHMILAPVATQLKSKRLLIVSDGALQYIPFAVLPEPGTLNPNRPGDAKEPAPLIAEHEIVTLPSASVLAVLRQDAIGRKAPAKAVAVLADPVFTPNDARVSAAATHPKQNHGIAGGTGENESKAGPSWSAEHLTRSVADVGLAADGIYLPRLRFTRQEADAIMAVTPAGQGMKALDFDASRKTATSPELSQYRVVHFATHGLLDSEHPQLSGLVLSMVDEHGKPQNGFLELEDIYNLNLPAELVVLSACETGLGKQIQGEGLVGLTRGFMYAGASRVLASLWKVDDVATAELMKRFYQAMEKDGMPPAAALRQAQIEMWKQKDWQTPYYWAAFQMQGEWK